MDNAIMVKTAIYATVSSDELALAMITPGYAASSGYVSDIIILVTDKQYEKPKRISEKITLYYADFGSGYECSIENSGYNQIAARNFLIEKIENTDAEWILMHDADDLYDRQLYEFIATQSADADAVTCSCFTLRQNREICVPVGRSGKIYGEEIHDPHTRIWRKSLNLRY